MAKPIDELLSTAVKKNLGGATPKIDRILAAVPEPLGDKIRQLCDTTWSDREVADAISDDDRIPNELQPVSANAVRNWRRSHRIPASRWPELIARDQAALEAGDE